MKFLGKYWKVLIAVALVAAAAFLYFDTYRSEKAEYEAKVTNMETMIQVLETKLAENRKYAPYQEQLTAAKEELASSRLALYEHFPVEMLQEDQIMYVLYLETLFGTEIAFSFNEDQPMAALSDGSTVNALVLTVNYKTNYEGFKDMVDYLATDSRITSVYECTIDYDVKTDVAQGYMTLILYLMDSDLLDYANPDVAIPSTGKDNVYK